jgi:hypothetical protein
VSRQRFVSHHRASKGIYARDVSASFTLVERNSAREATLDATDDAANGKPYPIEIIAKYTRVRVGGGRRSAARRISDLILLHSASVFRNSGFSNLARFFSSKMLAGPKSGRGLVWKFESAMIPKIVSTKSELVGAIRDRRDALNISHSSIDALAGLADGHTSKLLCGDKGFGAMSLDAVLRALALRMVVVRIEEDPEQRALMAKRWTQRKRPQRK